VIGNSDLGSNNAVTVMKNGDVAIGHYNPEARLHIWFNSDMSKPHLLLYEHDNDYGRLMFKNFYTTSTWTIAGAPNNTSSVARVNFFYSATGDILSITGDGKVGINTTNPSQALHVVGDAYKTNGGTSWAITSDIRLKNLLGNYEKGLQEITTLQPVTFRYKSDNPRKLDPAIEQVGFVAQEVQKIFPEAVSEGPDGYLDFNIHSINVAMINAIKELNAKLTILKNENEQLKARCDRLETENRKITSRLGKIETLLEMQAGK